ncbi:MAG TPA: pyruvate kinase [Thermoanaerobaculia bacterium]|nr:pyruvate kinase [Thermoanaerobaculia bacterium]
MERRAKIVATLGPASSQPRMIARLLRAGVDVFRLNLSHGTHTDHAQRIAAVRQEAATLGRFVPVLLDLMGPRYRLAEIADGPRMLKRGQTVRLGPAERGADLPVDDPDLLAHVKVGERILIDNGLVELEAESKKGKVVVARVATGGPVSTRKGINLPDSELGFSISEKDRSDIAFAVAEGADYLAASYVASPRDLTALREVVQSHGGTIPLVAKIERASAIAHMEKLVTAADAVMVARGDLGVEVPIDQVPVLQKRIVLAGRATATPVIVATQMLESMMERPRPTRAEVTDVANAVLEGADALMLSGETAAGRYPVEAVETMARVIATAEEYRRDVPEVVSHPTLPGHLADNPGLAIADVVCASAAHAASRLGVSMIVAFSQGGFTARSMARYRPQAPIRIFTWDEAVARRVQLIWGVRPLLMNRDVDHLDQVVQVVDRRLREEKLARPGESIVLLMGDPIRDRPMTNLMRVHRFGR